MAKTYAVSASAQRQSGVSSSSNVTDQALGALAHERGINVFQAAQEAARNPEVLKSVASRQIDLSEVGGRSRESGDTIRRHHETAKLGISDAPSQNAEVVKGRNDMGAKVNKLEARINKTQQETKQEMAQQKSKLAPKQKEIEDNYSQIDEDFKKESEKGLIKKTWNKVVK